MNRHTMTWWLVLPCCPAAASQTELFTKMILGFILSSHCTLSKLKLNFVIGHELCIYLFIEYYIFSAINISLYFVTLLPISVLLKRFSYVFSSGSSTSYLDCFTNKVSSSEIVLFLVFGMNNIEKTAPARQTPVLMKKTAPWPMVCFK